MNPTALTWDKPNACSQQSTQEKESLQCVKCGTKGQGPFACTSHFEILQLGARDLPWGAPTILKRSVPFLGCGRGDSLCFPAMICLGRHQSSTNWKPLQVNSNLSSPAADPELFSFIIKDLIFLNIK